MVTDKIPAAEDVSRADFLLISQIIVVILSEAKDPYSREMHMG